MPYSRPSATRAYADPRLLEPVRMRRGLGQVEAARPQDRPGVDAAPRRVDERRPGVRAPQERPEPRALRLVHQIHLVHHDDVRELDLVAEQLRDGPLVLGGHGPAAALQGVRRAELVHERVAVDDRHQRVEARDVAERRALGVLKGEGLGDGQRLGDAGALDQHVVEGLGARRELRQLHEQILAQRAADAAVRERDQLLLGLDERRLLDELRIDVHFRHVVDHDGDA